jgi:hypothetical protein
VFAGAGWHMRKVSRRHSSTPAHGLAGATGRGRQRVTNAMQEGAKYVGWMTPARDR